jgi:hypothetical protein
MPKVSHSRKGFGLGSISRLAASVRAGNKDSREALKNACAEVTKSVIMGLEYDEPQLLDDVQQLEEMLQLVQARIDDLRPSPTSRIN